MELEVLEAWWWIERAILGGRSISGTKVGYREEGSGCATGITSCIATTAPFFSKPSTDAPFSTIPSILLRPISWMRMHGIENFWGWGASPRLNWWMAPVSKHARHCGRFQHAGNSAEREFSAFTICATDDSCIYIHMAGARPHHCCVDLYVLGGDGKPQLLKTPILPTLWSIVLPLDWVEAVIEDADSLSYHQWSVRLCHLSQKVESILDVQVGIQGWPAIRG